MIKNKKKVLILFAHPNQRNSRINLPLFNMAKKIPGITTVDLYAEYPSYYINSEREQKRLLTHDVIIFQYPMYWYSMPSLLKEWQDAVLEYNFAYGENGILLRNKIFMCSVTVESQEVTYTRQGYNYFTIREFLYSVEQMAYFTRMKYLAPFVLFDTHMSFKNESFKKHIHSYYQLLTAFVEDRLDIDKASKSDNITSLNIETLLR